MGNSISNNEILHAIRVRCVEDGQALPEHVALVDNMRKEDNPLGEPKAKRGDWAQGLGLKDATKEKVDVLFHAGCRFSYDEDLRDIVREDAIILKEAGVDVGIAGREEACCGLRAFDIGFRGEMEKYAEDMVTRINASGATKLVTPCADCYSAFKYYYPWIGAKVGVEILHITEYLERLMLKGKLRLKKEVPLRVTYHDPCHLGRLGEAYEPWNGKWVEKLGHLLVSEPRKPVHSGEDGVYKPPRNVLSNIPGLEVVEMERNRLNCWCCGAGGGALEAFPDFAHRTAMERIAEAKATGAEALVTSCPWCERNFRDAIKESGERFKVYDIAEVLKEAK
jgi:Fe-S oxidoreductase